MEIEVKKIMKKAPKEPAEYSAEFCETLLRYFCGARETIAYDEEYLPSGEVKRKKPVLFAPEYPTLDRFARQIGVTVSRLLEWKEGHPEFAEACAHAEEAQKSCLIANALNRNYDAGFAKFLLCRKFPGEFSEEAQPPDPGLDIRVTYGKNNNSE